MPVKFYYVLAFHEGVKPLLFADDQPHFLGKTSDLVFKTEPDKTIDLDDGSTEVGSEKLTLSLSILGAIQNPWPIGEVWLVPAISDGVYDRGEYPAGDVLRVYLRDVDDYHIETKSGEFELTRFSASIRYAADAPAYDYYRNFFNVFRLHLFPNVTKEDPSIAIKATSDSRSLAQASSLADCLITNQIALVSEYLPEEDVLTVLDGTGIASQKPTQKGIFIHRI